MLQSTLPLRSSAITARPIPASRRRPRDSTAKDSRMTDLRFDVSNPQTPDAGPVIYISTDADKWGRLTLTLTNTRTDNSDVTLDPSGVLQIYFEMLTPADIERIKVPDDSAWAGGPDVTGGHLELHPKNPIVISSQQSVSLELHDVLGETPRQG